MISTKRLKRDRKGRLSVKLSCPKGAGICDGTLSLKSGRVSLGSKSFRIRAGKSATLRIKPRPSAFRRAGKKVTASVFSRDSLGTAAESIATLKLRKK